MPEEWNTAIFCPIYKKEDPVVAENYREIPLVHTGSKLPTTVMMKRPNPYVAKAVGKYRCGFQKRQIDHGPYTRNPENRRKEL